MGDCRPKTSVAFVYNLRCVHRLVGVWGIEFPQSQARASEVMPTQVLQGIRKKRVRYTKSLY
jgi:hypothetical protein